MGERGMPLAQLRRHFDSMLGDQLETDGRTPAPESSHRLDQQLVIPVPVAAGPQHEVGLGVPIAVPELRVNTEVEQMQTIAVHTPISGQDIELCRGQRPDCFRPTKRRYGERASAATDGRIWLGHPDDSHGHSGLPGSELRSDAGTPSARPNTRRRRRHDARAKAAWTNSKPPVRRRDVRSRSCAGRDAADLACTSQPCSTR